MRIAINSNISQILQRFFGSRGRHVTNEHESAKRMRNLEVHQVGSVEVFIASKQPVLNRAPIFEPAKQIDKNRSIHDDQIGPRRSRMMSAALSLT